MKKIIAILMMFLATSVCAAEKVVVIPMFGDDAAASIVANWLSGWEADIEYKKDDMVQFDGSSYIAIADHTSSVSNIPPDETYWNLVAASGATGPEGPEGPPGSKGDTGDTVLNCIQK